MKDMCVMCQKSVGDAEKAMECDFCVPLECAWGERLSEGLYQLMHCHMKSVLLESSTSC